jgi:flagellar biosynthesis GTPase FlhF
MRGLLVGIVALSVSAAAATQQSDIFATLGTTSADANNRIIGSFTTGTLYLVGDRTVFKAASPEQRADMVRAAMAVARAYALSDDFSARYARFREAQRPQREELPQNGDEALAAQQKQLEDVVKQAQEAAANLSPEAKQQLESNVAEMKRQLAELYADPEHRANVDKAVKESAREAEAEFARSTAEFEAEFPADINTLVTRRLHAFLELSATVDYSAKLVEGSDKKMHFADPAFEAKRREWKMMYRAGKPAVDAARVAAEEWLKAIGK